MGKVSGHSGLREEIELRQLEEKYNQVKTKRELQIKTIRSVLDPMPQAVPLWLTFSKLMKMEPLQRRNAHDRL